MTLAQALLTTRTIGVAADVCALCVERYFVQEDLCLMNIRPQDFLSHEPTLWFRRH